MQEATQLTHFEDKFCTTYVLDSTILNSMQIGARSRAPFVQFQLQSLGERHNAREDPRDGLETSLL